MSNEKPAPERMSRAELQALQLERMRWSLQHAYDNVPHYRHAFEAAGVRPSDLESLADLARFPFTAKQDLRDNYPYGLFAVPMSQVVRVHASSGTTGAETAFSSPVSGCSGSRSLQAPRATAAASGSSRARWR